MQRVIVVAASVLCLVNCSTRRLPAEDRPPAFVWQEGDSSGALIHDHGSRWVEIVDGREKFHFEEVERTDERLELLDRGRDVGLKVYSNHGELRLPRATRWQPWRRGEWIELDELPESVPFVPTDRKVRLVYFVPSDREPIEGYERRIRVAMELVSDVYRRALADAGVRSDGFELESDSSGQPAVRLVRAAQPAAWFSGSPNFDQGQHFRRIRAEIPASVGSPRRHKLVVFAESYEPGPAPVEWNGSVGVGAHETADGGVAVMSAWILRDEFCAASFEQQKELLLDETPIVGRTAFGTRRHDSPRFEFIEDGYGAVAHELGHALGLPHDTRSPLNLMGQGFRRLRVNYDRGSPGSSVRFSPDNARLLAVSRYLAPSADVTDEIPPSGDLKIGLDRSNTPHVSISLAARDDRKLAAVLFVDLQRDTVIGSAELEGTEQTVEFELPVRLDKGETFRLRAKIADAGGNITDVTAECPR